MSAETEKAPCVCQNWARTGQKILTKHHPNCTCYDAEGDARDVVERLLKGIEAWGAEEDGVYPECWEAYRNGKIFVGQFDVELRIFEENQTKRTNHE